MANTSMTIKNNEISAKGAQELVTSVKEGMKLVSQGYLAITPHVAKLYDCKGYKALGYKNFDELCTMEFGMSHGTTVGIRKVFDKFGTVSIDNKYSIPDKYLDYGYTKLLLFTDKKFAESGINPIEAFTPDMTIAEMKEVLKSKLEDKAEKQDAEAIDTTASDVSRETSSADTGDTNEPTTLEPESVECTPKDLIAEILADVQLLKEMSEMNNWMKPEKLALFDAVLANMKEIKKILK